MKREIGSDFYLDDAVACPPQRCDMLQEPLGADTVFLSSGRSAILLVLQEIEARGRSGQKKALIPSFICDTVIEPFLQEGYTIYPLPIGYDLCTDGKSLLQAVERYDANVVFLHRYFGFDTLRDCMPEIEMLRARGVVVIEDRTQSLYSTYTPLNADFWIGSLRKWGPLPDGAFAACMEGSFSKTPESYDTALERAKLQAIYAKGAYIYHGQGRKEDFLRMFREAETLLDQQKEIYAISPASVQIQLAMDLEALKNSRRKNYLAVADALKTCKNVHVCFPILEEESVPLYLPIWVDGDKYALQAYLRDASIYAPTVWPRPDNLPEVCGEAEQLYEHILCLPIDQRYDLKDMQRMAERVRFGAKESGLVPDVYYLKEWRELYAERDGVGADCYKFEHPDGTVIYPYVLRKAPEAEDGAEYYDIITPYGFNGPCVIDRKNEDLSALVNAFDADFSRYCKERRIIAEYVRFSPWLNNAEIFGSLYNLRNNGQTIAIDLTVNDVLRDEISSKRRNLIRAAEKKGVIVEFDDSGEGVDTFYQLYQNTIQKNEIGNYYQFSLPFLRKQFEMLGCHVYLAHAKVDSKIISSSFLLQCGDQMHYHLSANDYSMTSYQGNSLLLYEAAKRGKAYGCKYLHLGGVGVAEPSLMHFKLSFTKQGIFPFFIGSRVQNPEIVQELTMKYSSGTTSYFPPYRG